MKWLLLLTILSGYSGSSTVARTSIARMFVRRLLSRMSRRYGNFTGTRLKLYGPAALPLAAKIILIEVTRIPPETWGFGKSGREGA
jgi:hypothetical protein